MRRSSSYRAWALATAFLFVPAITMAQAASPVVAVLYFDNNSIGKDRADYDNFGKGIADLLINDMAANPSVRVVERDRIQALLQEHSLIKAGSVDAQTAVQLGKILGAQYMITGGFMSDGRGSLILTSRVVDVQTSRIMNPVKLTAKGDDVLGLVAQLSTKLNTDMKLPGLPQRTGDAGASTARPTDAATSAAKTTDVAATQTGKQSTATKPQAATPQYAHNVASKGTKLDVKTALLYSKALEEQDSGNNTKAAELYRAVLVKFPDFGPAKANLQKVQKSAD
jgi:TolB-like protein